MTFIGGKKEKIDRKIFGKVIIIGSNLFQFNYSNDFNLESMCCYETVLLSPSLKEIYKNSL